ncbi:hypothetical protein GCM10010106_13180 [Thermopolyspora flexuosa]|uniref:Uncharacterized protein n=1 Tax=Thermopolyspora flexuosa TaxID=103836 RepID=A0A543IQ74_9ACTN|nr:hypothetical protein [Thermopolyspora flexuosa]TQM72710.1 hypothetical protein FHX40_4863 [Thermopolyspora flexuosa]GGM68509.1 hypothetical protein GCM10010106_13180 [Thermopolyspora flexuosa]
MADHYGPARRGTRPTALATDDHQIRCTAHAAEAVPDRYPHFLRKRPDERPVPGPGTRAGGAR